MKLKALPKKRAFLLIVLIGIFFIEFAGIRINFNIIKTLRTEDLCVDMPATVSPQVKFPTINTKINTATVTEDDRLLLFAILAQFFGICNNHLTTSNYRRKIRHG